MLSHDKHLNEEKIAAFVDNALPLSEREEAAKHLAACEQCAALAKALYNDHYALQRLQTKAPEGFADKVMEKLQTETVQPFPKPRRWRFAYGVYAAAAALMLVVGVYFWQGQKKADGMEEAKYDMLASAESDKGLLYAGVDTYDDAAMKSSDSAEYATLPPEALFPEADVLLKMDAADWNASSLAREDRAELMRVPSEAGGFLAAFPISYEEYEALLPKAELVRETADAEKNAEERMYVLLVEYDE